MFDASSDVGPARELPLEAHRRFRADLRARKERNLTLRAEQLALHEEKKRVIAEWASTRATEEQRSRYAAGVLPVEEVIDALTAEAFSGLNGRPRYLDGAAKLQAHLRATTGRADVVVGPADLQVAGVDASSATSGQWAVVRQLKTALPDADVKLREHRLSWRRDPDQPGLTVFSALVTRQVDAVARWNTLYWLKAAFTRLFHWRREWDSDSWRSSRALADSCCHAVVPHDSMIGMERTENAPNPVEIKVVGKSGQISLGKSYAGKTLRLERRRDGTMVLTAVAVVPESQLWTLDEPHRSQIARGLAWAAETPAKDTDLETLTGRPRRHRGRK